MLKHLKRWDEQRTLKKFMKKIDRILALAPIYAKQTDVELSQCVQKIRRLSEEEQLIHSFAALREVATRVLGLTAYPVQLLGAYIMTQRAISEMKTGEGKTLVAIFPAFYFAVQGKATHIVTVNDYLVQRDAEQMQPVFDFVGMHCDYISSTTPLDKRKQKYKADILYITNNELGFDFLRDSMALYPTQLMQRGLEAIIIDEVDSVLLDDARTPLIISDTVEENSSLYLMYDMLVKGMQEGIHFEKDESSRQVWLLDKGIDYAERLLSIDNLASEQASTARFYIENALQANHFKFLNKDYIQQNGQILIIDEGTGRISEGRRYAHGLHQAIEAKEGVSILQETQAIATITYQNFFLLYEQIGGMTGTAKTEETELMDTYRLAVFEVPTNRPIARYDAPDRLFVSKEAKYDALATEIKLAHERGQPILVGTASIEKSYEVSKALTAAAVPHRVLNAKNHAEEADIIAGAGRKSAVTVATNMAGRGVDIRLSEEVLGLGGLYVIGTERHANRRIDNQLRGRSGRQGEIGKSQFYLSLEDDMIRVFMPESLQVKVANLIGGQTKEISHPVLLKVIYSSQERLEGIHQDQRKQTIHYDAINNAQRVKFSEERSLFLHASLSETREYLSKLYVNELIMQHTEVMTQYPDNWLTQYFAATSKERVILMIEKVAAIRHQLNTWEDEKIEYIRVTICSLLNYRWAMHLLMLEQLKETVRFASYRQADPVLEYERITLDAFNDMMTAALKEIVSLYATDIDAPISKNECF